MRRTGLPDLPSAIEWLRQAWDTRDTPNRLHEREHEGWGLYHTPAFARRLDAKPDDKRHDHAPPEPRKPGAPPPPPDTCPWRYPTWRSLVMLRASNRSAHDVILEFVINGYSVSDMARLGIGPGALLAAIRRLFACYEQAPVRVGWVDKSASQQAAEGAVA